MGFIMTLIKRNRKEAYKIEREFDDLIIDIYVSNGNKGKIEKLKREIETHEIQGYPVEKYKNIYENIITEYSH